MSLKIEIEGVMLYVVSAYAPQVECDFEEKEKLWNEMDEGMQSIPRDERVEIGADFNGHVGEGNRGDEKVIGRFGIQDRNAEGQTLDFGTHLWQEHRVTYRSGRRIAQVDSFLC